MQNWLMMLFDGNFKAIFDLKNFFCLLKILSRDCIKAREGCIAVNCRVCEIDAIGFHSISKNLVRGNELREWCSIITTLQEVEEFHLVFVGDKITIMVIASARIRRNTGSRTQIR